MRERKRRDSNRRAADTLDSAMTRALQKIPRCGVHRRVKPCEICEETFTRAERQQKHQVIAEQQAAHKEFIAGGGITRRGEKDGT